MAWDVVPLMPQRLTSAPVRGALQVAAMEPNSVQSLRLARSIHFQVGGATDDGFRAARID